MNTLTKFKIALFILIFDIFLLTASGLPWVDAQYQFQVSQNLSENKSLSFSVQPNGETVLGKNGRFYDRHGLANVLLLYPVASLKPLLYHFLNENAELQKQALLFACALVSVFVSTLTCYIFFELLLALGIAYSASALSALCFSFLSIIFPYHANSYEGNLNLFSNLTLVYFLFAYLKWRKPIFLLFSGFFAGVSLNGRDFSLIIIGAVLFYLVWRLRKEKKPYLFFYFLIGALPWVMIWGYYNWLRTGCFCTTVLVHEIANARLFASAPTGNLTSGLMGLFFSPGGSILIYSPILLLTFLSWPGFIREKKYEAYLILTIIIFYILANAKILKWFGLWSWGPRYTLEIIPFMLIPLGYLFAEWEKKKLTVKIFSVFVVACSFVIQLAGTLTNWHGRLDYLLTQTSEDSLLNTFKHSQWFDAVKVLLINFWNMIFGNFHYIHISGYDASMSLTSYNASLGLFTFWNRLLFLGVHPVIIWSYLTISLVVVYFTVKYIWRCIKKPFTGLSV